MANEQRAVSLINRGLQQRARKIAVMEGDTAKVEAIDKKLAATPTAASDTARDQQRRRLVGKGYEHLAGPEITALRARMAAAASVTPAAPSSGSQMIANGLKARKSTSRHDESFIPNWAEQGGIRRT